MSKIKTLAELRKMKDEMKTGINLREKSDNPDARVQVKVAMATCGIAAGSKDVMDFLISAFEKRSIDAIVTQTGCMGYCFAEPTAEVTIPGKEPVVFGYVDLKKADDIIEKYIKNGELLEGIIPMNFKTID
ncbi:MAG TPA: (2Fe-2S) ferredoxin domain-containing protein [Bacteroidales bacterium]|nr:(2Fe-2S) ferredoxin domain-containing protein [Bacteroidales bacterium]